jgi:hypothetical protein
MASIIGKDSTITIKEHQKEVIDRCNEAYDRGGADTLRIVIEAARQVGIDNPEFREHAGFAIYLVEGIRQKLAEAVDAPIHDEMPEESKIIQA